VSFVSYHPGPPLNEFVEYVWLIEGGQVPRLEKILPSGTIELVVNLRNDEIYIHDPEQPDQFKVFSGAVFSGTYERSFICNAQQHEAILGFHFKAGGAFPFLGAEASELTNAHTNLLDLWGRSGLELRERLCTASTPQERFRIIDATLRNRLQNHANGQLPIQIAQKIFAMVGNRVSIREISRELGFSQRRFIQIFNSFVGLNPKVFYRIQRFQRARVLAERRRISNWAELAVTCGYFDQSHLIKDFKEFSGSTPKIYSVQQEHKDAGFKDNHVPLR